MLKNALLLNALFSTSSALFMLAASTFLSTHMPLPQWVWWVTAVGLMSFASLLVLSIETVPELGSSSPVKILRKVDFPEPFAPIRPYLLFPEKDMVMFSKSGSVPNCIDILSVDIMVRKLCIA